MQSNAVLDQFLNRISFSKPSNKTLKLLGNAHSYLFVSIDTPHCDANSLEDNS